MPYRVNSTTLRSVSVAAVRYGLVALVAWILGVWTREKDIAALVIWVIITLAAPVLIGVFFRRNVLTNSILFMLCFNAGFAYSLWRYHSAAGRDPLATQRKVAIIWITMYAFTIAWSYMSVVVRREIDKHRIHVDARQDDCDRPDKEPDRPEKGAE